jgi:hypothetical protein
VIAINAPASGSRMVEKWIFMHFVAASAAFALATLARLRTGVFLFFKGDVTIRTYIFVVAPLALSAFLIAFMIPETSAFAP